ncbi:aspartate/glutamate racemase family protein [Shewanella eurypsychrophilus]|uniref:Aspartate/glutamate racemase family protein n=1 Tax=Shewanella eurypsychrophilus TaxID=2593656 RepID=A0ABX6V734_9GAMM|nr:MULTISPECIES: aspartate/glutamate racemase family protein [Shewanella]QFU22376.1 amino acid racemase [Shewanella sp. YLB-09]QPG57663.1 aspartate/glutamate racemase family protein [Shewanella eurypsychrophilus]
MKTIGMIGGMSWESTVSYYQAINQGVKRELGGLHSGKIVLNSVDFAEIERLQHIGDWDKTANILTKAALSLEAAGADFFLICTNTMHKVADEIAASVTIPLLHIADATGDQLVADGIKTVGLLGTQFTMEQAFYKQRLTEQFAIEVMTPEPKERALIHSVIYEELCLGDINANSRQAFLTTIDSLFERGAQAVILGCTEIALLVGQEDTHIPLYDTTAIHAEAAVKKALY